jgi:hypothetical protein
MKVYSPTQTRQWLICPRLWALEKEWRSKLATKRDVGAILGGGFARGMQEWYGKEGDKTAAPRIGEIWAANEVAFLVDSGVQPQNDEVAGLLDQIPTLTKNAIYKFLDKNPIPQDWTILASELEMGEEKCRLDLGVRDNSGPAIIDFKTKLKLEARYRAKTIEEYRFNPQQLHYCWRFSQIINEPVLRYYIVLVSLQPTFQASIHQFDVPQKTLEFWEKSYQYHWQSMSITDYEVKIGREEYGEDVDFIPPGNFNNCITRYGPCEFQPACHEYHHDPQLMAVEFVRKAHA